MASRAPISPRTLSSIYSFPEGATGAGHRIVLLEFGGGFHRADLQLHLERSGLSATDVPQVKAFALGAGNAPLNREQLSEIARDWSREDATFDGLQAAHGRDTFTHFLETLEVTADIQTVRALAPRAEIVVLFAQLAPSAASVIEFALDHHNPTVIATSWGMSEWRLMFIEVMAVQRALARAQAEGVTVCCATGDFGALNDPPEVRGQGRVPKGKTRVNWPASCPLALACGGSDVQLDGGARRDEIVWETDVAGLRRATGGGMSGRYFRPTWQPQLEPPSNVWTQSGLTSFDGRWLPDVAAHAGRTYEVVVGGETVLVDGTSLAAPLWAALLACISEKLGRKVGWINETLYRLTPAQRAKAFHDVTLGTNAMPDEITGSFEAGTGWDPCTGFGSPNGVELLELFRSIGAPPSS